MVDCPKCSTKLDVDFGMITCPSCTSVVFVEFDGTAKIADNEDVTRSRAAEAMDEQNNEQQGALPEPDLSAFDNAIADSLVSQVFQVESPEHQQETHQVELDSPMISVTDEVMSPNDPLGVSAYANSEFSQGKDGPFLFNLFISGLDSKEIRESLREAMNDSRFSFDSNHLLGQIRGGKLLIKNVSPVQASILVNRLKRLPLAITWEQHAITTVEKF